MEVSYRQFVLKQLSLSLDDGGWAGGCGLGRGWGGGEGGDVWGL